MMRFSDQSHNLHIELDTKQCELTAAEIAKFEAGLDPLRDPVKDFPVSHLYITIIFHPRSKDFHVKTSLLLSGRTLFTGDRDVLAYPAFERCVKKLVGKVSHYKARMGANSEAAKLEKGTHHEVLPTQEPEMDALQKAVEAGDYAAFRHSTFVYEEPIRKRVGRWIQRYPDVEAQLGDRLKIEDIVEEVFLNAFEQFESRPDMMRLGEWLEQLIDPSVKQLMRHPDEELENINFARTLSSSPPREQ